MLFVVNANEWNRFDQTQMEYDLSKRFAKEKNRFMYSVAIIDIVLELSEELS